MSFYISSGTVSRTIKKEPQNIVRFYPDRTEDGKKKKMNSLDKIREEEFNWMCRRVGSLSKPEK